MVQFYIHEYSRYKTGWLQYYTMLKQVPLNEKIKTVYITHGDSFLNFSCSRSIRRCALEYIFLEVSWKADLPYTYSDINKCLSVDRLGQIVTSVDSDAINCGLKSVR